MSEQICSLNAGLSFSGSFSLSACVLDLVDLSLDIAGMQQVMSLLASRLAQVGGVQLLDGRVLVGLPDRIALIGIESTWARRARISTVLRT